jgi:hypothetical protein
VVLIGLTGVGQWTRGLVFRCILGSEGCVLVPKSNGTPVTTWAWPIWVVHQRRVLEAVFILLEFPSPSRRIFIGSHSLHPLWFAVSVLQLSILLTLALVIDFAGGRHGGHLVDRLQLLSSHDRRSTVVRQPHPGDDQGVHHFCG